MADVVPGGLPAVLPKVGWEAKAAPSGAGRTIRRAENQNSGEEEEEEAGAAAEEEAAD